MAKDIDEQYIMNNESPKNVNQYDSVMNQIKINKKVNEVLNKGHHENHKHNKGKDASHN